MKITIDKKILQKYKLSLQEFIVLLGGYLGMDYEETHKELLDKGTIGKWYNKPLNVTLSNETKEIVHKVLTESNPELQECGIEDFEALAVKLQEIYPKGIKSGTTYPWRGTIEEVAQKLRYLVVYHHFYFTEEEAIKATEEYVNSDFEKEKYIALLPLFILRTKIVNGEREPKSIFMSIIEKNREDENRGKTL